MASFDNPKELRFIITLANGTFGSSTANQITLEGFRARVSINKAGGMTMGTLRAQIYGVKQSDMNACVTYPYQPQNLKGTLRFNTVQVFALDGPASILVFSGNIIFAMGNYQNQPDVFLEIQAISTFSYQIQPTSPSSFPGSVDVATAMKQIANVMGLGFQNNGVNKTISNQYLPNTALSQALTLARNAGIWMYIDNGVMQITPAYQPLQVPAPLISSETGMIGYPIFDAFGVNFKSLFNPAVIFGGPVEIQSDIPQTNGTRIASSLSYDLDSERPDGLWFMRVRATPIGFTIKEG